MRIVQGIVILAGFVLVLAGCASTPMASPDSEADAKEFNPALNAAVVYIYRPIGSGPGISTIWLDGRLVGETLPETFFRVPVRAGRNRITTSGNDSGRLEFNTQSGGVYFVEARVSGDSQSEANSRFRLMDANVGKADVERCCRMLETWRPSQPRLNY